MIPLVIGRRVVATGNKAQVLDLCARLRERGIDATVPPVCAECEQRRLVPSTSAAYARALCSRCYRRVVAGERLTIDYEREAERRGGAEPK